MKKLVLLLLVFLSFGFSIYAQNNVTNGSFENWISNIFSYPQNYPFTSNSYAYFQNQTFFNVTKSTDAYHGNYAVQLTTNTNNFRDTTIAYLSNSNPNNSPSPFQWHGGIPYNQKPLGIRGWYKYNVATNDSGTILVVFSHGGTNIGTYIFQVGGMHSSYSLFNFTFKPALTVTPDSVIVAALSCKYSGIGPPHGIVGSTLLLDSLSFTGVGANQPAALNGDFESWQPQTIKVLTGWYFNNGGDTTTISQTTDAADGQYAVELKTFLVTPQGHATMAVGAQIANGFYPSNCTGGCNMLGGNPFTTLIDTLAFSYKYSPSSNDSALINLNFVKNGIIFNGSSIYLHASATYKYMELPINLIQAADTVFIYIMSSDYPNTDVKYAGSDLKIDHLYFKSQLKATPILSWSNPADITYGTLLTATQLNASADINGSFVYSPAIGAKLTTGNNQMLNVNFSPTDSVGYNKVSKTVYLNVLKAMPVITWANPADITNGTLLSALQLDASSGVAGTMVYNPSTGTKLAVGNNQNLSVEFIPADTLDYKSVSKTVSINVLAGPNGISPIASTNLKLYPNPATDNLNIESAENISLITIIRIDGAVVFEERAINNTKVSVSVQGLSPGLYFISITNASGSTVVNKLIVKTR